MYDPQCEASVARAERARGKAVDAEFGREAMQDTPTPGEASVFTLPAHYKFIQGTLTWWRVL